MFSYFMLSPARSFSLDFFLNHLFFFQCAMKGEGNRVEVERLPHLSELAHEGQAVEIASVQDPETGATR